MIGQKEPRGAYEQRSCGNYSLCMAYWIPSNLSSAVKEDISRRLNVVCDSYMVFSCTRSAPIWSTEIGVLCTLLGVSTL